MKKKIVLLVCALVVSLAGCGVVSQGPSPAELKAELEENETAEESEEAEDAEAEEADADETEVSDDAEDVQDDEEESVTVDAPAEDVLTEEQALEGVKNYWISADPEFEDKLASDDYTMYFETSTNDDGKIVVLYRSYTAAEIRYYVDPETGDTEVTEFVPGVMDEETPADYSINIYDYIGEGF